MSKQTTITFPSEDWNTIMEGLGYLAQSYANNNNEHQAKYIYGIAMNIVNELSVKA